MIRIKKIILLILIHNSYSYYSKISTSKFKYRSSEFPYTDLTPLSPQQTRIFTLAWHNRIMSDFKEVEHDSIKLNDGSKRIDNYDEHPLRHILNTINIIQGTFNILPENDECGILYFAWQPVEIQHERKGNCQCIVAIFEDNKEWDLLTIIPSPYWSENNIKPLYLKNSLEDLARKRNFKLKLNDFYSEYANIRFKLDWCKEKMFPVKLN